MGKEKKIQALPDEELEETDGEPLPDREVMSVITSGDNLPPVLEEPDTVVSDPVGYGRDPLPKH
jgi:hypothetical protein